MAVKIKGLDNWKKWIQSIPDELMEKIQEDVYQTATDIEQDAKANAPVDSGDLRRSINIEMNMEAQGLQAEIGTNMEYSTNVEFGDSRQNAQPYLVPAYNTYSPGLDKRLRKSLKDVIN